MTEPFPNIPGWLVWMIIVFAILLGIMCIATSIAGIYMGKWWLLILGMVSCAIWYFKVFSRTFLDMGKRLK